MPSPDPARHLDRSQPRLTSAHVRAALEAGPLRSRQCWSERDVLLYHLSLGAGRHAATDPEEHYTLEDRLQVLPTFALVAGQGISSSAIPVFDEKLAGLPFDPRQMLHAGQQLRAYRPIPTTGDVELTTAVTQVIDKGSGALVFLTETASDAEGEDLWSSECRLWLRGAGGFGGEAPVEATRRRPSTRPDHRFTLTTGEYQALLYRLNGDMNPLHADRGVAAMAGFDRPILHGLASYGMVAKGLVDSILGGAVDRLISLDARFRAPVLPGQSLTVQVWAAGADLHFEVTCPEAHNAVVLDRGLAETR